MSRRVGLEWVAALVRNTGDFAQVVSGVEARWGDQLPRDTPKAWVRPTSWKTDREGQGGAVEEATRIVNFEVVVTARPGEGKDLDELADSVEAALEGQPIGASYPALTTVDAGRLTTGKGESPDSSLIISGSFAYPLPAPLMADEQGNAIEPPAAPTGPGLPTWWPAGYWMWAARPRPGQPPGDGFDGDPTR